MHDSDGPVVAQAVYQAFIRPRIQAIPLRGCAEVLAVQYSAMISKTLKEDDQDAILTAITPSFRDIHGMGDSSAFLAVVHQGFSAISSEVLPDPDAQNINEILVNYIQQETENVPLDLSLAQVVDDVVRYLRVDLKLPPSRWAPFVHVGV